MPISHSTRKGAHTGAPLLTCVLLLLSACGAKPTPETVTQSIEPAPAPTPFPLVWADFYGGTDGAAALGTREEDVLSRLAEHGIQCELDTRLAHAARRYAESLAESGGAPSSGDMDRLRYILLASGVADYAVWPLVADYDSAGVSSLYMLVNSNQSSLTHCGIGISKGDSKAKVVFIGTERHVELGPVPTKVAPGQTIRLKGKLGKGARPPVRSFIGYPDGRVDKVNDVQISMKGSFTIDIPLKKPGRNEIELLVDQGRGPETAVLVPIFVGTEPDTRPVVSINDPNENAASPEQALLAYLNRYRKRLGLAPLRIDQKLSRVARMHSQDMVDRSFFGHVAPNGSVLEDRLAARRIEPAHAAENVARSITPLRIHRNLTQSPSHRINLVDPQFTHVGIGIASDGDQLVATQIFARF